MLGDLLLLSGNDIPFPGARVNIHQPTLKEIAFIGEERFFTGCSFLNFSKNLLNMSDKSRLENCSDFDIFMSIMITVTPETKFNVESALLVLNLIFPLYHVSVRKDMIVLTKDEEDFSINRSNFNEFKSIIEQMFNLNLGKSASTEYNPVGDMSRRIAEKFKKRHEILNKLAGDQVAQNNKVAILSRYASILAIGLQISLKDIMDWTVYQLYEEFQRFQLKLQWDAYVQAKMAGAKDLEEVDNWMIDLQEQGKNKNKNKK